MGKRKRRVYNISGLRNQKPKTRPADALGVELDAYLVDRLDDLDNLEDEEISHRPLFDSTKANPQAEIAEGDAGPEDGDVAEWDTQQEAESSGLRQLEKKERPKKYKTAFTSTAEQTQQRHKKPMRSHERIDTFFVSMAPHRKEETVSRFEPNTARRAPTPLAKRKSETPPYTSPPAECSETFSCTAPGPPTLGHHRSNPRPVPGCSEHHHNTTPEPAMEADKARCLESPNGHGEAPGVSWEEELLEVMSPRPGIFPWSTLRDEIKKDLKKGHKKLTLSQVTQLVILRNFATLRLKGTGSIEASLMIASQWNDESTSDTHFAQRVRALAQHYQVFGHLPPETDVQNAQSPFMLQG